MTESWIVEGEGSVQRAAVHRFKGAAEGAFYRLAAGLMVDGGWLSERRDSAERCKACEGAKLGNSCGCSPDLFSERGACTLLLLLLLSTLCNTCDCVRSIHKYRHRQ